MYLREPCSRNESSRWEREGVIAKQTLPLPTGRKSDPGSQAIWDLGAGTELSIKKFDLLEELSLTQGVVERKTTIP